MKKTNEVPRMINPPPPPLPIKCSGSLILDNYPDFITANSFRKLRSDINPKCNCKGGYCYKWSDEKQIVRVCD
jgi:hypothetical protein